MDNDVINILIPLLMSVMIIRILMKLFDNGGIDWLGMFECLWKKTKQYK